MKKDLKKKTKSPENITYSDKEMKRYLGALNEMHSDNLKGMKEGFQIMNGRFDRIDKKLDQHTEMLGVLMVDVSILKDDMQIVKKELKKKVDYDEFLSLVQRVNKLEAKN